MPEGRGHGFTVGAGPGRHVARRESHCKRALDHSWTPPKTDASGVMHRRHKPRPLCASQQEQAAVAENAAVPPCPTPEAGNLFCSVLCPPRKSVVERGKESNQDRQRRVRQADLDDANAANPCECCECRGGEKSHCLRRLSDAVAHACAEPPAHGHEPHPCRQTNRTCVLGPQRATYRSERGPIRGRCRTDLGPNLARSEPTAGQPEVKLAIAH